MDEARNPEHEAVAIAFLRRYRDDSTTGRRRSLAEYQSFYPGFEAIVEREFASLHESGVASSGVYARLGRELGGDLDPCINLWQPESGDECSGGRYVAQRELGRGGMGEVIQVWDRELRRPLAMKVLPRLHAAGSDGRSERDAVVRFLEEAQITAQLDHPGIVPVHELGVGDDGRAFFTMSLIRGRTFGEVIEFVHTRRDDWSLTRAVSVLLRVCEAVAFAHDRGVVHRDLKPANVMVGSYGETYVVDWGLARVVAAPAHAVSSTRAGLAPGHSSPLRTQQGDVVGTPAYMAPEQALGDVATIGPATDVYAIGAMLYHLMAGRPPYTREVPEGQSVLDAVRAGPPPRLEVGRGTAPAELVAICERAMAREPGARYGSALALAEDLRASLERRVVRAYEQGAWAELRKWVARNRALAAACAALVVALAAGFGVSLLQKARADHEAELAEDNFRLAFGAVDEFLTEVGASVLNDVPQMQPVQRALLERAANFHTAFLASRQHDAKLGRESARSLLRLAGIRSQLGDAAGAAAAAQDAIDRYESLCADSPRDWVLFRELARACIERLRITISMQQRDQLEARALELEGRLRRAVDDSGGDRGLRELLAQTLCWRAHPHPFSTRVDWQRQCGHLREAVGIMDALLADATGDPGHRGEMLAPLSELAACLERLRDFPEAIAAHERVLAGLELLLAAEPGSRKLRDYKAHQLASYARTLRLAGDAVAAERQARVGLAVAEALVRDYPAVPIYRFLSAKAGGALGGALLALDRSDEARAALEAAVTVGRAAFAEAPGQSVWCEVFVDADLQLGRMLLARGEYRAAASCAERLAELANNLWASWYAADFYARCIAGSRADEAAPAAERAAFEQRCAVGAVQALRHAAAAGFKHASQFEAPKFAVLADREDYRELLRSLRGQ
ncbi:MAG TPA: serine/threonine-protein kinase [Planctomycetota bacterium]|nr:serine/threonine-protein kinase [Planctomycetota bacterium]